MTIKNNIILANDVLHFNVPLLYNIYLSRSILVSLYPEFKLRTVLKFLFS